MPRPPDARAAYDVILLDVWLPGADGLATLARMRERQLDVPVVMISGHGNIESAVRAIKLGAFDFIEKPLSLEKTMLVVRNALRQRRLEAENRALRARVDRHLQMVGESYAMRQLREQVAMAAPTNGRVLIYGDNGTGKELVARTIHALSRRRAGPFVEVNCAAIPEELIESELFGHVKGAFTGAVGDRRGKFELADGGTIFLDEIGDMSLKTQAKVLRVLQEQVVEPVGGTSGVRVDVRVLAATNKELPAEIRAGRFREDLYFRLNVIPIFVPPLRDRADDIPLLAEHFMAGFAREYGRRVKTLDPGAVAALQEYPWPGNVRELRNVIERLIIMVPGDTIGARDLAFLEGPFARPPTPGPPGRRRGRPDAAGGAEPLRARLHPEDAGGAERQHLAHGRRARRRAQQPLPQDARARHRRARGRPRGRSGLIRTPARGRRPQSRAAADAGSDMADRLHTDATPEPEGLSAADRDSRIEQLLLTGLDHYFAGEYERAISAWTRVLFLDRGHARAKAYIDRARGAIGERQRESDELLHRGVDAFNRGETETARRLLTAVVERGGPQEVALSLLERLVAPRAAGARGRVAASRTRPPPAAAASSSRRRASAVAVPGRCRSPSSASSSWRCSTSRARASAPRRSCFLLDWGGTRRGVGDARGRRSRCRCRGRAEIDLDRARVLLAQGHPRDALRLLERIGPGDPLRAEAARLREDIQRELLSEVRGRSAGRRARRRAARAAPTGRDP